MEPDGLTLADGETEGESEAEGETDALGETLGLADDDGDTEALGLTEADGETEALGLTLEDGADSLKAAAIITWRALAEMVAWIVPVAPAVARIASAIASPWSAPVPVPLSARSIQVPLVGAVVVSVAPEAVVGSVAASKAEAVRLSPAEVIATMSSPATAVLKPAVVTVPEATARVLALPVSKGAPEPPE